MNWLAPTAALLGVIIGGLLNAILTAGYEHRREFAAAAVAARLVRAELELTRDMIIESLADGRWGSILDPGLPYSRGFWAVDHREGKRPDAAWLSSAPLLARVLTAEEWEAVVRPYGLIDRTSLQFPTDEPDRDLTSEADIFFRELVDTVSPALQALEQVARGRRHARKKMLPGHPSADNLGK
jgi:hypothetical protein